MDSSPWVRRTLRAVVVVYLVLLVGWPVSLVVRGAFADGLETFQRALADPVSQAKAPETRARRIEKAVDALRS